MKHDNHRNHSNGICSFSLLVNRTLEPLRPLAKKSLIRRLAQAILDVGVGPVQSDEIKFLITNYFASNDPESPHLVPYPSDYPCNQFSKVFDYCLWIGSLTVLHTDSVEVFLPEPGTPFDSETMLQVFSSESESLAGESHGQNVLFACQLGLLGKSSSVCMKSGVLLE